MMMGLPDTTRKEILTEATYQVTQCYLHTG